MGCCGNSPNASALRPPARIADPKPGHSVQLEDGRVLTFETKVEAEASAHAHRSQGRKAEVVVATEATPPALA